MLASGIEPGHGTRDYLIDVSDGASKALTPEGVVGVVPSADGRNTAVLGPEGKWAIWTIEPKQSTDGPKPRAVPGLDSNFKVSGWSADGASLLAVPVRQSNRTGNVYQVNAVTGKMDLWKTFGDSLPAGTAGIGGSFLAAEGGAYAYHYMQTLSQVYVIRGMR